MLVQENVPLAPLTTLKVGGPARYFIEAGSASQVRETFKFAAARRCALFVMGGGSNLVVSDEGWPGVVMRVTLRGVEREQREDKTFFDAAAGEDWDSLVALTVASGCAGMECLSGIPGTVGGAPIQNIGAYGQDVSQSLDCVTVLDRSDGQVKELCREACGFAYRSSIFNTCCRDRYVVLRVRFALSSGDSSKLHYAELKQYFAERGSVPTLSAVRDAVRTIRASKGMLIESEDENARSVGSFFKNPVLPPAQWQPLLALAEQRGAHIPMYPAEGETRKVSAAWLVEHSGFTKGYTQGRVGISRKHSLAIVNRGGASAAEVLDLQERVRASVYSAWGVELEPEPVFVGF